MLTFRPRGALDGPILAAVLVALLAAGCHGSLPGPPPSAAPAFADVDRLLEEFRERGAFPGGVLAVGHRGALVHLHPFGRLTYDADAPPVTAETLYDLASLTKVVATTTMAMILVDEGRLDLDRPVRELLPEFQGPGKEAVTVRHLLTHSSGLQAIVPLYKEVQGRAAYRERILALDLLYPAGSRSVYSDPGVILLGEILEQAAGRPLEAFVRERVFEPLGMRDARFRPPVELRSRIAPTEFDPWRGRLVHGEVHAENAFALGGVAPHAGLFATAGDLARFAQMLLNGGALQRRRVVSRETVELFTRRAGIPGSDRALGWDTKSAEGSSAGSLLSARSFGHTGFTGTSIWIDPERRLFVILLTNRVHPTRENNLIREVRPAVADAVVRALWATGPAFGLALLGPFEQRPHLRGRGRFDQGLLVLAEPGSGLEQEADDFEVVLVDRSVDQRKPGRRGVRIGAGFEQDLAHLEAAHAGRLGERRHLVVVGPPHVGARFGEGAHERGIPGVDRLEDDRLAAFRRRRVLLVRRHAAGEQRLEGLELAPLDREPERGTAQGSPRRGIDAGFEEQRDVRRVPLGNLLEERLRRKGEAVLGELLARPGLIFMNGRYGQGQRGEREEGKRSFHWSLLFLLTLNREQGRRIHRAVTFLTALYPSFAAPEASSPRCKPPGRVVSFLAALYADSPR